jgi:hypothetical protein
MAIFRIVLCVVFFGASISHADSKEPFFSAEDLAKNCESEGDDARLFCRIYTRGVLDGLMVAENGVCVDWSVSVIDLEERILNAQLQFVVNNLSDNILLGLPSRDLSKITAADFVRWAFLVTLKSQSPQNYRCTARP